MKRNRFTDEQIIGILKEHKAGTPVSKPCRKHGVSDASIYKWNTNERHFRLSWDSQDGANLNPCCKREVCDGFGGFVAG